MSKISSIKAMPILDSRGAWTIEASLITEKGTNVKSSVPQGKSKGSFEAVSLPAEEAAASINEKISKSIAGSPVENQRNIDDALRSLDGTPNKSNLGANAILAVSMACARAAAIENGVPLWLYLRQIFERMVDKNKKPRLFMNVINGGLHAGNNLDFQEYMIIPKAVSIKEGVENGVSVYKNFEKLLKESIGSGASNVGDEGGFAPNFKNNREPLEFMMRAIKDSGLDGMIDLGMDAAASSIKKSADELKAFYTEISNNLPIIYIEDPFIEDRFDLFSELNSSIGSKTKIVGDDLTVTNVDRMKQAKDKKSVEGVIIKPNQVGTISETLDAIRLARDYNWQVVVSHRSGETDDDFIADLGFGVGADGMKLGAPARGERIAKYNRLIEIEGSELK